MKRLFALAVTISVLGCASGGGRGSFNGDVKPVPFSTLHLVETSARVGYHFSTSVGEYVTKLPSNGKHCGLNFFGMKVQGTLPPGLKFTGDTTDGAQLLIEGTPRTPGDWEIMVSVEKVFCSEGPDQTEYGPRSFFTTLHVAP